jgi:hypothetical protein
MFARLGYLAQLRSFLVESNQLEANASRTIILDPVHTAV